MTHQQQQYLSSKNYRFWIVQQKYSTILAVQLILFLSAFFVLSVFDLGLNSFVAIIELNWLVCQHVSLRWRWHFASSFGAWSRSFVVVVVVSSFYLFISLYSSSGSSNRVGHLHSQLKESASSLSLPACMFPLYVAFFVCIAFARESQVSFVSSRVTVDSPAPLSASSSVYLGCCWLWLLLLERRRKRQSRAFFLEEWLGGGGGRLVFAAVNWRHSVLSSASLATLKWKRNNRRQRAMAAKWRQRQHRTVCRLRLKRERERERQLAHRLAKHLPKTTRQELRPVSVDTHTHRLTLTVSNTVGVFIPGEKEGKEKLERYLGFFV